MLIHEYQAKKILNKYGIIVPKGNIAYTPDGAKRNAKKVSSRAPWVVKAQIYAGARSKGRFLEKKAGKLGGIRVARFMREVVSNTRDMLNSTLVTPQTGEKGKIVNKIYIEEYKKVTKIFYAGMIIDRMKSTVTLILSPSDDDDILKVSLNNPEKILKIDLDLEKGAVVTQIREALDFLNLPTNSFKNLKKFINAMHQTFLKNDAILIEINPAGISKRGEIIALDAKMSFDKKALYRHPDIAILQDETEYLERQLMADKYGFLYHEFDGNVGMIVNGDGVSISLADLFTRKGEEISCNLNVKGGVDKDKIAAGIKIIMTNPKVEGILINILGGFLRCNLLAEGIVAAAEEVGLNVPLVVRFEGINKEYATDILEKSKLPITIVEDMEEAVDSLIKLMKESD